MIRCHTKSLLFLLPALLPALLLACDSPEADQPRPVDEQQPVVQEDPPSEATAEPPQAEPATGVRERRLFVAGSRQCVLRDEGRAYCRGLNDRGQLGDGTTIDRKDFTAVAGDHSFKHLDFTGDLTWALTTEGALYYWGDPTFSDEGPALSPRRLDTFQDWSTITARRDRIFGIRQDGTLWFLSSSDGRFENQQLGEDDDWYAVVYDPTKPCGLRAQGELWCWEPPWRKQEFTPERVGEDDHWASVIDATVGICGIRSGELWCFGNARNLFDWQSEWTLRRFGDAADWKDVSITGSHVCAIRDQGQLWCWGENDWGQVGDGTRENRDAPVRLREASDWVEVAVGLQSSCGLRADGTLWCWGVNPRGLSPSGEPGWPTTPARIDRFQRPSPAQAMPELEVGDAWDFALLDDDRTLAIHRASAAGIQPLRTLSFPEQEQILSTAWVKDLGLAVLTIQTEAQEIEAESLAAIPNPPSVRGAISVRRCHAWRDHFRCTDTIQRLRLLEDDQLLDGEPRLHPLPQAESWRPVSIEVVYSVENDPGEDCEGPHDEPAEADDPIDPESVTRYIPEGATSGKGELIATPDGELWMHRCLVPHTHLMGCAEEDLLRLHPSPRRDLQMPQQSFFGTYLRGWEPPLKSIEDAPDSGPQNVSLRADPLYAYCRIDGEPERTLNPRQPHYLGYTLFWLSQNPPIFVTREGGVADRLRLYTACLQDPHFDEAAHRLVIRDAEKGLFAAQGFEREPRRVYWHVYFRSERVGTVDGTSLVFAGGPPRVTEANDP